MALEATNPERGFHVVHPGTQCPRFCHDGASFVRQQSIRKHKILIEFYSATVPICVTWLRTRGYIWKSNSNQNESLEVLAESNWEWRGINLNNPIKKQFDITYTIIGDMFHRAGLSNNCYPGNWPFTALYYRPTFLTEKSLYRLILNRISWNKW
jgi:hypothetical protein